MNPLHDNDLDRISREAAERFEVDSGASGWAHLEKRLDEELPQKKKRRRFLFWLFFITATTGGALIGLLKYQPVTPLAKNIPGVHAPADKTATQQNNQTNHNQDAGKPEANTPATGNNTISGSSTTAVAPAPTTTVGDQEDPALTTRLKIKTPGSIQPASPANQASTPDKHSLQPIAKAGNAKKQQPTNTQGVNKAPLTLNYATIPPAGTGKNKERSTRTSRGKQGKQQNATTSPYNRPEDPLKDNKAVVDAQVPTADQSTTGEPGDANKVAATIPLANDPQATAKPENTKVPETQAEPTQEKAQEPAKKERKKDDTKQPLEIGLVAGPDLSAVEFGPLYKTGYIFGLQLGYRFSDRWSVNTGVLYTKKYYQADSQYFKYKSNWPTWKLDDVEGNCAMWEIPVNVRYDVSFNDKRRWYVSTGLSTYLMDQEHYTLNYVSANGTPYPVPKDTNSNSNYVFSIWNLSVGFERSLGRNFSIQAEPYLKIPLTGLGMGSMRMNSYGVFFSLKYKPNFHSKKSDNRK